MRSSDGDAIWPRLQPMKHEPSAAERTRLVQFSASFRVDLQQSPPPRIGRFPLRAAPSYRSRRPRAHEGKVFDIATVDPRLRVVISPEYLPPSNDPDTQSSLEPEIELIYARLRQLAHQAEHDPRAEAKYQRVMTKLRQLQRQEAERLARAMDAQFGMRPGEGYAALKRADEVLAKYGHPASTDDAAGPADS
jgi:hypothetical protein